MWAHMLAQQCNAGAGAGETAWLIVWVLYFSWCRANREYAYHGADAKAPLQCFYRFCSFFLIF